MKEFTLYSEWLERELEKRRLPKTFLAEKFEIEKESIYRKFKNNKFTASEKIHIIQLFKEDDAR